MLTDIYPEPEIELNRREALLLRLAFVFLILASLALAISPAARLGTWTLAAVRLDHLAFLPAWAACAWLIHRVLRSVKPQRDPYLLPVGMLLAGWGILSIWRVLPSFGARQTGWLLVATVALVEILRGPSNLQWLRRYRYLWFSAGAILLSLTLLFGTNPSGGDLRLWLGCCGIYLQPSEPLRLLLIAFVASYFADRMTLGWSKRPPNIAPALGPLLAVWGISLALLIVQRDLGTGMLFFGLLALLLYVASHRWQVLAAAGVFALLGAGLGYALINVVRLRLQSWANPWADPIGGSYQLIQSLIALATGGLFGRGPGMGSPGVVPAAHTDFIFAGVAEEWGVIGSVGMLTLFAIFVSRGFMVALRNKEPFKIFLVVGLALSIGLQAILITGGVIRLFPLTGVTLPFVSYGGSSLVTSFLALAILMQASNEGGHQNPFVGPILRLQTGLLLLWGAMALGVGWWGLYQAPSLVSRNENPRRRLSEAYVPRGRILDRRGEVLAESTGEVGSYERIYPAGAAASLVGYSSLRFGQAGIEASMDPYLRGDAGHDHASLWWSYLLRGSPARGLDVRLTIDLEIQRRAEAALSSHRGAVVVLDATSGDILALASHPTYESKNLEENWESLVGRSDAPLLNRASQAQYQPGGSMAPYLLAWSHGLGVASPEEAAPGAQAELDLGGATVPCGLPPDAPSRGDLAEAARRGCPAPFADLSLALGAQGLQDLISGFALDRAPQLRIESAPVDPLLIPPAEDDFLQLALGQGDLTISPLQAARAYAAFANGGVIPPLRIVDGIRSPEGVWQRIEPLDTPVRVLPPEVAGDMLESTRGAGQEMSEASAMAIVGPEGEVLAWYLAASTQPARVVVVALEAERPEVAQNIGRQILARASESS